VATLLSFQRSFGMFSRNAAPQEKAQNNIRSAHGTPLDSGRFWQAPEH
jgi:hypothetical protein